MNASQKAKYTVGDKVWIVENGHKTFTVKCPDCLGGCVIPITLQGGEKISLACAMCGGHGGDAKGYIEKSQWAVGTRNGTITGVEVDPFEPGRIRYSVNRRSDCEVFPTEEAAISAASHVKEESIREAQKRFLWQKESANQTWSWNLYYHRNGVRDAKREIAYHEAKITVAKEMVVKHGGKV